MSHAQTGCPGDFAKKAQFEVSDHTVHTIFGLWAKFNSIEKAFVIGVSVWNFLCLLSGYLSVSMQKDVSGLQIFLGDFYV